MTFSHENGDELVCAFTWGEHVGIEIERTNGESLFESTPLLQHLCCTLMGGLGRFKAEAETMWKVNGSGHTCFLHSISSEEISHTTHDGVIESCYTPDNKYDIHFENR